MKKLFSLLLVLFLTVAFLFADVGLKHNQKNIKCIQTEYFDIVFSEECSESAAHIAVNADRIYTEICNTHCMEKWLHIPVVISSATEVFYTSNDTMPHTKIIIVDSTPEELTSTSADTLLDAFRHEVTHTVLANHKNNFFKGLGKYTSDFISFWLLTSSSFLKEGSAVASESSGGTGPLHDPYYLHHHKQALVEEKFPGVSDVEGVRDIYPFGKEAYYFGGPFTDFIQKKYGMQKYADFIYKCVNGAIFSSSAFKKTYGISMDQAWNEFKNSITVPSVKKVPTEEYYVTDFFCNSEEKEILNNHGSLYNSFATTKDSIGYYDISNGIYYTSKSLDGGKFAKSKKLFEKQNVVNVKFSADGSLYAVTSINSKGYNKSYEINVKSTDGKNSITAKENNLRDAAIIETDGKHYLSAVKVESQYNSIVIYKINTDSKNRIAGLEYVKEITLSKGDSVYSLTDAGNGKIACILQKGYLHNEKPSWQICLYTDCCNIQSQSDCYEITVPVDDIHIKYLTNFIDSDGSMSLAFSWATKDTFPRLGFIKQDNGKAKINLMNTDVSGGIYNIACIAENSFDFPTVVYNSRFYNKDNIYIANCNNVTFTEYTADVKPAEDITKNSFTDNSQEKEILNSAVKFKSNVLKQSFILPVGIVSSQDSNFNSSFIIPTLGFMWKYYALWGSKVINTAAAYDLISKTGGFTLGIEGTPSECGTDRLSYSETANIYLDKNGFANAVNNFEMKLKFPAGNNSSIIVEEKNDIFAGHEIKHINFELGGKWVYYSEPENTTDVLSVANTLGLFFSTKRSAGTGYFEKKGISFGANYSASYKNTFGANFDSSLFYQQISPVISFNIPRLLPITCRQDYSYNLPLQLDASLYPDKETFLNANAEIIFFAKDLQFVPKPFPFFTRRFILYGDFYANLKQQNSSMEIVRFIDNARNIGSMTFSPGVKLTALFNIKIIGLIDNMGINKFGISVIYEPIESKYPKAAFTMNMVF